MNRLNPIARRLVPAAAAAGITAVLFSVVVSVGEPQRSQTIATQMLERQQHAVAVAAESAQPAAALTVALADDPR